MLQLFILVYLYTEIQTLNTTNVTHELVNKKYVIEVQDHQQAMRGANPIVDLEDSIMRGVNDPYSRPNYMMNRLNDDIFSPSVNNGLSNRELLSYHGSYGDAQFQKPGLQSIIGITGAMLKPARDELQNAIKDEVVAKQPPQIAFDFPSRLQKNWRQHSNGLMEQHFRRPAVHPSRNLLSYNTPISRLLRINNRDPSSNLEGASINLDSVSLNRGSALKYGLPGGVASLFDRFGDPSISKTSAVNSFIGRTPRKSGYLLNSPVTRLGDEASELDSIQGFTASDSDHSIIANGQTGLDTSGVSHIDHLGLPSTEISHTGFKSAMPHFASDSMVSRIGVESELPRINTDSLLSRNDANSDASRISIPAYSEKGRIGSNRLMESGITGTTRHSMTYPDALENKALVSPFPKAPRLDRNKPEVPRIASSILDLTYSDISRTPGRRREGSNTDVTRISPSISTISDADLARILKEKPDLSDAELSRLVANRPELLQQAENAQRREELVNTFSRNHNLRGDSGVSRFQNDPDETAKSRQQVLRKLLYNRKHLFRSAPQEQSITAYNSLTNSARNQNAYITPNHFHNFSSRHLDMHSKQTNPRNKNLDRNSIKPHDDNINPLTGLPYDLEDRSYGSISSVSSISDQAPNRLPNSVTVSTANEVLDAKKHADVNADLTEPTEDSQNFHETPSVADKSLTVEESGYNKPPSSDSSVSSIQSFLEEDNILKNKLNKDGLEMLDPKNEISAGFDEVSPNEIADDKTPLDLSEHSKRTSVLKRFFKQTPNIKKRF